MYKCKVCGNEFEGKFCPECGTKWVDKVYCPNCGKETTDGAKFCEECGALLSGGEAKVKRASEPDDAVVTCAEPPRRQPIEESAATASARTAHTAKTETANKGAAIAKIYKILRYVPMTLFALYSVLLFAFYAASLAGMEVGMFGITEYESAGSVYSMLDGLTGISVALIVFGLLALTYSAVLLVFFFRGDKKNREVKLFGKFDMTLGEALSSVSIVIYLVFVILSAVAMGQVSGLNDDMGGMIGAEIVCGAASKLVLAFAVIFMVFAAAAIAVRIALARKSPELWEAESVVRNQKEAERIASLPVVSKTDGESRDNDATDKASADRRVGEKPLLYYAYSNKKMQRALVFAYWCMLLTMLAVFAFIYIIMMHEFFLISPHLILLIGSCAALLAIALCLVIPVKKWTPESFRDVVSKKKKHDKGKLGLKRMIAYYMIMLYLTGMTIGISLTYGIALRGYIIAVVYGFVVSAAYIVAAVAVAKRNHALSEYLFGQPGPPPGAPLVVEYNEQEELAAYNDYKTAVKQKTAKKDDADVKKKLTRRRVRFGVAASLFAVVSIFAVIASPLLTDKFSASYVASMKRSDVQDETLQMLFGDPNFIYKTSDNEFFVEYYGDNYLDLYEQYYDLEKRMEKAETDGDFAKIESLYSKMETLEKQASSITYKYLRIGLRGDCSFNSSESKKYDYLDGGYYGFYDAEVTSILLDKNACKGKTNKTKSVESVKVENAQILVGFSASSGSATAEIYYGDGSYVYRPLTSSELASVDTSTAGVKPLTWKDEYGSYSSSVTVSTSVSRKCRISSDSYNASTVKYTVSATRTDGVYSYRLAFSDFHYGGYISQEYMNAGEWNIYAKYIDELYFDASIKSMNFVECLKLSEINYPSLEKISVAEGNTEFYAEDGVLYNKHTNGIIYSVYTYPWGTE